MPKKQLVITTQLNQYTYIDQFGETKIMQTPIKSSVTISLVHDTALVKRYDRERTGLNTLFYVQYDVATDVSKGDFMTLIISDTLLDQANGFIYGTPTVTSTSRTQLPSERIKFNQNGTLMLENYYLQHYLIPAGDDIVIHVPVQAIDFKAKDYLEGNIFVRLSNLSDSVQGTTENTITLQAAQLNIKKYTTWQGNYAYSGECISYFFVLFNEGIVPLTLEKGALIEAIPREVTFLGWGINGDEEAPEGFSYEEDSEYSKITNSKAITIQPTTSNQREICFRVRVK